MAERKTSLSEFTVRERYRSAQALGELPCLDVRHFVPALRYSRQRRACKLAALKRAGPQRPRCRSAPRRRPKGRASSPNACAWNSSLGVGSRRHLVRGGVANNSGWRGCAAYESSPEERSNAGALSKNAL